MGVIDDAHAFLSLHSGDTPMERFHLSPVHLWPEMMFGVIPVVEENPIVNFAVAAHTPGDRFVGVATVMTEVTVEITKAVPEIEKRQEEKDNVTPVQQEHDE